MHVGIFIEAVEPAERRRKRVMSKMTLSLYNTSNNNLKKEKKKS
jgi:hypothetical protein